MSQQDVDFTQKMADENYADSTQYKADDSSHNSSKTNSMSEKVKKQFKKLSSSSTKNEDDVKLS